jgi:hypothetical protein
MVRTATIWATITLISDILGNSAPVVSGKSMSCNTISGVDPRDDKNLNHSVPGSSVLKSAIRVERP